MVEIPDPESKIDVTRHTDSTAASGTDKSAKQLFFFPSTATPSARNPVTSPVCRARHARTGAPASGGCRPWEGTDDTGGDMVVLMSRPSCCLSLEKTARVRVKKRTPCCAPFLLASLGCRVRSLLKTLLEGDCCPEVAPPGPAGPVTALLEAPTYAWSCSRPSCDPPSRRSSSCHTASNHQSGYSAPVRLAFLLLLFPPWHCSLARQHLSDEIGSGGDYQPAQQSPKSPPLLARPSKLDPGAPSNSL